MVVLCVELRHVRCAETPVGNVTVGVFAQAAMTVPVSFAVNPESEMQETVIEERSRAAAALRRSRAEAPQKKRSREAVLPAGTRFCSVSVIFENLFCAAAATRRGECERADAGQEAERGRLGNDGNEVEAGFGAAADGDRAITVCRDFGDDEVGSARFRGERRACGDDGAIFLGQVVVGEGNDVPARERDRRRVCVGGDDGDDGVGFARSEPLERDVGGNGSSVTRGDDGAGVFGRNGRRGRIVIRQRDAERVEFRERGRVHDRVSRARVLVDGPAACGPRERDVETVIEERSRRRVGCDVPDAREVEHKGRCA